MLFVNARDEPNIKEWVLHHLNLNFDIIYIFDHKSRIPLNYVFKNFSKKVIIERCNWNNPVKIPLMNRAVKIARSFGADWMIYLDADEFLVLNHYKGVKHLLQSFNDADSLGINWLMFGTSFHKKTPNGLIIENYTKSEPLLDQHVKTFARPNFINKVLNPHSYKMVNPHKMLSINKKNISNSPAFNPCNIEYKNAPAFIAHYIYQSEETYIKRKINLPTDYTCGFSKIDINIHRLYNTVDNYLVKEKYTDQIKNMILFIERNNNKKNSISEEKI